MSATCGRGSITAAGGGLVVCERPRGLPPGAHLDVRDIRMGYLSPVVVVWLRDLPLTVAQARVLTEARDPAGYPFLELHYGLDRARWPQLLADVPLTLEEAHRLSTGEPWDLLLGLRVPLIVVPKAGEARW